MADLKAEIVNQGESIMVEIPPGRDGNALKVDLAPLDFRPHQGRSEVYRGPNLEKAIKIIDEFPGGVTWL